MTGYELILALDAGNGFIKAVSSRKPFGKMVDNYAIYRHALRQLTKEVIADLDSRGVLEESDDFFQVNGKWYAIGESAIREGESAYKLGEARYTKDYYGILTAIALFKTSESSSRVFVYGTHTPKDMIYRPDLINSTLGEWKVKSHGETKTFKVIEARGGDEPVMAFRHAILDNEAVGIFSGAKPAIALRNGYNLTIDLGSFTLATVMSVNGKTDYESARSSVGGVLEARYELEKAIRREFKKDLRGANRLNPERVDEALRTGFFNAGSIGEKDVKKLTENVLNPLLTEMFTLVNNYGGFANFDTFLLAGGGCALLKDKIIATFKDNNVEAVYLADEAYRLQHATAYGAMKTIKLVLDKERKLD